MKNTLQNIKKLFLGRDIWDYISDDDVEGLEKHLKRYRGANKKDKFGQTPIFRILYNKSANQHKMLELLIKYGADVNFEREDGTTPIFYAKAVMARILIKNGAVPYKKSVHARTPLFYVADLETLEYMLDLGLDVNQRDNLGNNALHNMVYYEEDMVKTILKYHAEANAQNNEGITPLMYLAMAEYRSDEEQTALISIAKILTDHKADTTLRDNEGKSAVDYAKLYNNLGLEQWLRTR